MESPDVKKKAVSSIKEKKSQRTAKQASPDVQRMLDQQLSASKLDGG